MTSMEEWIASRPECVRKLAAEFPPGSILEFLDSDEDLNGEWFILGYTEDDHLIITRTDPAIDYDAAAQGREYICASHLRENQVKQ